MAPVTDTAALLDHALGWLAQDPDPRTADELRALIAGTQRGDAASTSELADAFAGELEFGTAGLRGRLGPGSNRMNRVVVLRAAAGLARYLQDTGGHSIVIGYDARHNSDVFARDTARVMAGAGIRAMVLPRPLPTPVLAFAIHHLGASAGVMVTASHNPAADNGYKVYLGDGIQIVPPADHDIARCIRAVGPISSLVTSDDYSTLDNEVVDAYIARAVSLVPSGPREVSFVYTALHGVGAEVLQRVVTGAGFAAPVTVAEQQSPDPDFPTVPFPNPEEAGAMDLAMALARGTRADIVIANDPDADRCAAAIPSEGDWRMLSGDEAGWLLGWWTIERARLAGGSAQGVLAQSIVSGDMLRAIATDAGLGYAATLTGFKWVARVPGLVFGYEEALGYCVDPEGISDKDGVTAALLLLELTAHLKARGRDLQDALDDLARRHGVHVTGQLSVRVAELAQIGAAMVRLRELRPTELAGREVLRFEDLEDGIDGLPPTDGVRLVMDGARVIVRPSGTEPKLKCYLQVVREVDSDLTEARSAAASELEQLRASIATTLGLA